MPKPGARRIEVTHVKKPTTEMVFHKKQRFSREGTGLFLADKHLHIPSAEELPKYSKKKNV